MMKRAKVIAAFDTLQGPIPVTPSSTSCRVVADMSIRERSPVAATRNGNRIALAQAMALGLGVIKNARTTPAAAEISALADEIRVALSG
jgi:cellulose biosynthesis protein BcsQ